ncbi:terpene synthase metal binding domain protein [Colletotrichum higginsianum]|nr:terpene synthase metal binding domain protein [Colletotrichum higginsianum]
MATTTKTIANEAEAAGMATPATAEQIKVEAPGQSLEGGEMEVVDMPDLCASFMSAPVRRNPAFEEVKREADQWISDVMVGTDPKWPAVNKKANLALLSALWDADSNPYALRTINDFASCIFAFDDQFDEGPLATDLDAALDEIAKTRAILDDQGPRYSPEYYPIRYVFQTLWDRVKGSPDGYLIGKQSSDNFRQRWKWAHDVYFDAVAEQVRIKVEGRDAKLVEDEFLAVRRGTVGTSMILALLEWCAGIDLPRDIVEHPSIREAFRVVSDLLLVVNDILSYKKDVQYGVDHNLIISWKSRGFTTQESMDKAGDMLNDCFRRWYTALAELPRYGEDTDRDVCRCLDIYRNVAVASLHWSFETGRYLGKEGAEVRATRKLRLPKYMSSAGGVKIAA